ncbi:unnamed protein product [Pleuronectes platessa]|uniref:Uncharacterized protein n=1 Tax=Pleuronectes platessa TaxID=8262 RepID=A0A9N7UGB9_PLEPL|nr:unnamed protein product [Pleuronectes platessa]
MTSACPPPTPPLRRLWDQVKRQQTPADTWAVAMRRRRRSRGQGGGLLRSDGSHTGTREAPGPLGNEGPHGLVGNWAARVEYSSCSELTASELHSHNNRKPERLTEAALEPSLCGRC